MKKLNMMSGKPVFTDEEINKYLQKVIADPVFLVSDILKRFLSFVVKETLAGRSNQLKEYSIGLGVLNRGGGFKPQEDGVVRVHAARLRRALNDYYEKAGKDDLIRIYMPKGTYIPDFYERDSLAEIKNQTLKSTEENEPVRNISRALKTGVLPFNYYSQDEKASSFAGALTSRLSSELSSIHNLSVIFIHLVRYFSEKPFHPGDVFKKTGASYIFTGDIQFQGDRIRINIQLIHAHTLEQIWSRIYDRQLTDSNLFEVEDEVVKMIINEVETIFGPGKKIKSKLSARAVA